MKSDSSKRQELSKQTSNSRKPKHTKSKWYRDKVKCDTSSVATSQAKEDSHKKHPKMDYISKAVKDKLKEYETLCPQQKDELLKSSTIILKSKKKLSSHGDTLNKLKYSSYNPDSIVKKIEITASKRTMESNAFKQISE